MLAMSSTAHRLMSFDAGILYGLCMVRQNNSVLLGTWESMRRQQIWVQTHSGIIETEVRYY